MDENFSRLGRAVAITYANRSCRGWQNFRAVFPNKMLLLKDLKLFQLCNLALGFIQCRHNIFSLNPAAGKTTQCLKKVNLGSCCLLLLQLYR